MKLLISSIILAVILLVLGFIAGACCAYQAIVQKMNRGELKDMIKLLDKLEKRDV